MTDPCYIIFKDKRLKVNGFSKDMLITNWCGKARKVSRPLDESLVVKRNYYGTLVPQINIWNMDLKIEIVVPSPSQKRISADTVHLFFPQSSLPPMYVIAKNTSSYNFIYLFMALMLMFNIKISIYKGTYIFF